MTFAVSGFLFCSILEDDKEQPLIVLLEILRFLNAQDYSHI